MFASQPHQVQFGPLRKCGNECSAEFGIPIDFVDKALNSFDGHDPGFFVEGTVAKNDTAKSKLPTSNESVLPSRSPCQ